MTYLSKEDAEALFSEHLSKSRALWSDVRRAINEERIVEIHYKDKNSKMDISINMRVLEIEFNEEEKLLCLKLQSQSIRTNSSDQSQSLSTIHFHFDDYRNESRSVTYSEFYFENDSTSMTIVMRFEYGA